MRKAVLAGALAVVLVAIFVTTAAIVWPRWEYLSVSAERSGSDWKPHFVNGTELPNWTAGPPLWEFMNKQGVAGWELVSAQVVVEDNGYLFTGALAAHYHTDTGGGMIREAERDLVGTATVLPGTAFHIRLFKRHRYLWD